MLLILDHGDRQASVHYAYENLRPGLMKDLIEFWVNGIWLAKLLIKHPKDTNLVPLRCIALQADSGTVFEFQFLESICYILFERLPTSQMPFYKIEKTTTLRTERYPEFL